MKRIILVITVCTSIFLFSLQYRLANYNEAYVSYNYPDYISKIIGLKQCSMEFQFNSEEDGKKVIDMINDFVRENKYTYLVSYYETLSNSREQWKQIIYSPNQDILSRLYVETNDHIDFSNINDNKYYSTEINDKKSSGYIRVLDKQWFNKFGFIYQFETPYHLEDYLKKDLSLYYYFFSNHHTDFYKQLIDYFKTHIPNVHFVINDYTKGYSGSTINELNDVLLENSQDIIILLSALFVVSTFIIVFKSNKEIIIRKMHGTSVLKIFLKSYLPIFILSWFLYLIIQMILLYVYMDEYNLLYKNFIDSLLYIDKVYSFGLLIVMIMTYVYIRLVTNAIFLKKKTFKEIVYIQNIVKICMIIFIVVPFIKSFNNAYPAVNRYIGLKLYEEELKNSVNIIIDNNEDKVFQYLNKHGKFVDFTEHMSVYKDYVYENYQELDQEEISEFALSYPKITANIKYLKDYHIKDENNNDIDYKKYQEDILLVPIDYKNSKELERYKHGTSQIIYIQNNGHFFDLSLQHSIIYVKNPIIHVTIKNSSYFKTNYLYCSLENKTIQEYYNELEKITHNKDFDIYDRKIETNIYMMDIKNDMIQFVYICVMYFIVLLLFIYLTVYIYIYENGKMLYIRYTLGHNYIQRYKGLIRLTILSYVIPLLISIKLNTSINMSQIIQFMIIFCIFEIIVEFICLHSYFKTRGINILKGETL